MRSLEQDLNNLELATKRDDYTGILCEIKNDVSPDARDMLIADISLIRAEIGLLAERFTLEKETTNVSRRLKGELSLLVVSIEEIMSQRLRGSGEVAEGLKESLDPELVSLRDILRHMLEILAKDAVGEEEGKESLS